MARASTIYPPSEPIEARCLEDRAEYSLRQATIVIALVLGAVSLCMVGVLRLRRSAFVAMPRPLAIVIVGIGGAVIAFAVFLAASGSLESEEPATNLDLATAAPSTESTTEAEDINVLVTDPSDEALSGVTVELTAFDESEGEFVVVGDSQTGSDGRVVFEDANVNIGRPAIVQAVFDGTRFASPVLRNGTERADPVVIAVAETTRSTDDLRVEVESVAIVGDGRGAQAVHAVSIRNRGDRAYVGELRLPVLPGGTAIQVQQGFDERRASIAEGEIIARSPVLPGRHDITYTYPVQSAAEGIRLRREVQLATERFDLLVGGELETRPSQGLQERGNADVGEGEGRRSYRRHSADDLERGDVVAALVTVGQDPGLLRIAGPVAAGIFAIAIVAIPLVRKRRRRSTPPLTNKIEASA